MWTQVSLRVNGAGWKHQETTHIKYGDWQARCTLAIEWKLGCPSFEQERACLRKQGTYPLALCVEPSPLKERQGENT